MKLQELVSTLSYGIFQFEGKRLRLMLRLTSVELIALFFLLVFFVFGFFPLVNDRSNFVPQIALPQPNVSDNWCEKSSVKNGSLTYGGLGRIERNGTQLCAYHVDNGKGGTDIYYVNENFEIYVEKYAYGNLVFLGIYDNNTLEIIKNFDESSTTVQGTSQSCSSSNPSQGSVNCNLNNGQGVVVVPR
ncbi:hypothetical protein HY570_03235 [Candidatus Micrarchaeota archaeon]|nr:hypothetical protein [Candidatus Micrarchaeota archaeon]